MFRRIKSVKDQRAQEIEKSRKIFKELEDEYSTPNEDQTSTRQETPEIHLGKRKRDHNLDNLSTPCTAKRKLDNKEKEIFLARKREVLDEIGSVVLLVCNGVSDGVDTVNIVTTFEHILINKYLGVMEIKSEVKRNCVDIIGKLLLKMYSFSNDGEFSSGKEEVLKMTIELNTEVSSL